MSTICPECKIRLEDTGFHADGCSFNGPYKPFPMLKLCKERVWNAANARESCGNPLPCKIHAIDVEGLPAGRELDALVAEKVMGWSRYDFDKEGVTHTEWNAPGGSVHCDWHPSTDIVAAWEIPEKFHKDGLVFVTGSKRLVDTRTLVWYAIIGRAKPMDASDLETDIRGEAEGETAQLAICRAALKAVVVNFV